MNEIDKKYFEAIKNNDTALLEQMVSEQAKKNGYIIEAYHGSPREFYKFSYNFLGKTGSTEGYGFYFTNLKDIAQMYSDTKTGRLYHAYLKITKSLNPIKKTITKKQLYTLIKNIDPTGDDILSNWGDVNSDGYNSVINEAIGSYYTNNDNDVDLISAIINDSGRDYTKVYDILKKLLKYDGIITKPSWGFNFGDNTVYVVFSSNQIKLADMMVKDDSGNIIPLSKRFSNASEDIRESLKIKNSDIKESTDEYGITAVDIKNEFGRGTILYGDFAFRRNMKRRGYDSFKDLSNQYNNDTYKIEREKQIILDQTKKYPEIEIYLTNWWASTPKSGFGRQIINLIFDIAKKINIKDFYISMPSDNALQILKHFSDLGILKTDYSKSSGLSDKPYHTHYFLVNQNLLNKNKINEMKTFKQYLIEYNDKDPEITIELKQETIE
jgi:hypothetical protein